MGPAEAECVRIAKVIERLSLEGGFLPKNPFGETLSDLSNEISDSKCVSDCDNSDV